MKRLMKKFEDIMIAVTFAEAGEYDTAKELVKDIDRIEEVTDQRETEPA